MDKDKIIDELQRENHALKTGPTSECMASQDLTHAEVTLKDVLDARSCLEHSLRHQEDHDSEIINRLDRERTHLK